MNFPNDSIINNQHTYNVAKLKPSEVINKGKRFHINGIVDVKSHIKKTYTYQYLPPYKGFPICYVSQLLVLFWR